MRRRRPARPALTGYVEHELRPDRALGAPTALEALQDQALRDRPEREIVAAVLAYLRARRVLAWRNNTGAMRVPNPAGNRRAERLVRFGMVGMPDILAILPGSGRALAVECRRLGETLTLEQETRRRQLEDQGALYVLAHGVRHVQRVLDGVLDPSAESVHPA